VVIGKHAKRNNHTDHDPEPYNKKGHTVDLLKETSLIGGRICGCELHGLQFATRIKIKA
jgi:hypothetical protein